MSLVQLSVAFEQVWPELADECGIELTQVPCAAVTPALDGVVLVAAGGEEETLPALLKGITSGGAEVVAIGADASHRLAVAVMQAGARDYFALPRDLELLRHWLIERAARDRTREQRTGFALQRRARYAVHGILGDSPALKRALATVERVIPHSGVTVLVTGETGTGKELLARAIHYEGPRREGPFVDINCAAIPEQLLESELFGHERGAFTGAVSAKPGLFEVASGGALFLDEIGHLALSLQGKLLRALEERTIRRVGGQRAIAVDVRVIAATHVDLAAAARDGRFRADLYHRLNVVPVELPALRDRREDILPLARHFLQQFAGDYARAVPVLGTDAAQLLLDYTWPGNVRELRNAMERAVLLAGDTLTAADLGFLVVPTAMGTTSGTLPFPASLETVVRSAAAEMLALCGGNKSEAARRLGISRPRLMRLTSLAHALPDTGDDDDV